MSIWFWILLPFMFVTVLAVANYAWLVVVSAADAWRAWRIHRRALRKLKKDLESGQLRYEEVERG